MRLIVLVFQRESSYITNLPQPPFTLWLTPLFSISGELRQICLVHYAPNFSTVLVSTSLSTQKDIVGTLGSLPTPVTYSILYLQNPLTDIRYVP